jgi:hypothetical protein
MRRAWAVKQKNMFFNQLSGYDVLTRCAVLCIVVSMMSLHIMHASNYTIVDMTIGNAKIVMLRLLDLLVTSECDRKVQIA